MHRRTAPPHLEDTHSAQGYEAGCPSRHQRRGYIHTRTRLSQNASSLTAELVGCRSTYNLDNSTLACSSPHEPLEIWCVLFAI